MSHEKRNMELMQILGDAWNSQDWNTFAKLHRRYVYKRLNQVTNGNISRNDESVL